MNLPPLKYFFSPYRWKQVIIWILKRMVKKLDNTNRTYLEKHELIQIAKKVVKCYPCVESGKCVNCFCDTVGLINNTTSECPYAGWGVELNKEEFEKYNKVFMQEFTHKTIRRNDKF